MESFGNGPPALGKRTEGPAQVADGVGKEGKEAQLNKDYQYLMINAIMKPLVVKIMMIQLRMLLMMMLVNGDDNE